MDPRDAETANDPTLFRMNNSRLYRWLSPDPRAGDISNPQSLNRYAYVLNNSLNLVDPLGLECWMVTPGYIYCVSSAPAPGDAWGTPSGGDCRSW